MHKLVLAFMFIYQCNGFSQPGLNFTLTSLTGGDVLTCNKTSLTYSVTANTVNLILCTVSNPVIGNVTGNPFTINAPGVYSVTVLDLLLFNSSSKILTVTQDVIAPTATGSFVTVDCYNLNPINNATLEPSITGPTVNCAFSWTSNCSGIISSANVSSVVVNAIGSYSCLVTNTTNGCSSQALFDVSCSVGITENFKNSPLIKVYPNPVNEKLSLTLMNFNSATKNSLVISDIHGSKITEHPINIENSEVTLSFLPPGFYFAELIQDNKIIYRNKFIKN